MNLTIDYKTLRKVQLCEIKCLQEVKRICEANNIPYFLIGGTLIGAVRHKGFIPWDDDIDVGMLRSDYDRFIKICQEQINKEKFFLQTSEIEEGSADYEIARIRLNDTKFIQEHRRKLNIHSGIFIEIIPYDDLPPTDKECKRYYYTFKYLKRIVGIRMGYRYRLGNPLKRALFYAFTYSTVIIPLKPLVKKLNNYHLKYFNTNSKEVFLLGGAYNYNKERHLRETVSHYTKVEFEGEMYPAPENYDLFLTEQYGNYMSFPPIEKQRIKCRVTELDFGPYKEEMDSLVK
ncbi:MAG: LicD family protein [Treponema sp.]|nr:LicD family protein [Treponema sp.]